MSQMQEAFLLGRHTQRMALVIESAKYTCSGFEAFFKHLQHEGNS
jgi:hypothetical protein